MKYRYTVIVVELGVGERSRGEFGAAEQAVKAARLVAGLLGGTEPSLHMIRQPRCERVSWDDPQGMFQVVIVKEPI